ncbi:hypothetical protein R3P38DRAFT_3214189 [Favolaschia claudopus]|uniref:ATP synthase protein MI25 n=1 Tax=Favolaschia claudopus TaxID=2862362 RepID=A0AAW0AAE1_9AGAR
MSPEVERHYSVDCKRETRYPSFVNPLASYLGGADFTRDAVVSTLFCGALSILSGNAYILLVTVPAVLILRDLRQKQPSERLRRLQAAVKIADEELEGASLYCERHWHADVVDITGHMLQIQQSVFAIELELLANRSHNQWSLSMIFQTNTIKALKSLKAIEKALDLLGEYVRKQWGVIRKIDTQWKAVAAVQLRIEELKAEEGQRRVAQETENLPYTRIAPYTSCITTGNAARRSAGSSRVVQPIV